MNKNPQNEIVVVRTKYKHYGMILKNLDRIQFNGTGQFGTMAGNKNKIQLIVLHVLSYTR
jgi:hypothetical protein